jgi:hypothetical protein
MTTYYLNTVPTPAGYSYYYTTSNATSSAASSAYSTAPSKRVTRTTSSGVSPSTFSAAYAKTYGESSTRPTRPPLKSVHSAPQAVDRSYATPRKCYEPGTYIYTQHGGNLLEC